MKPRRLLFAPAVEVPTGAGPAPTPIKDFKAPSPSATAAAILGDDEPVIVPKAAPAPPPKPQVKEATTERVVVEEPVDFDDFSPIELTPKTTPLEQESPIEVVPDAPPAAAATEEIPAGPKELRTAYESLKTQKEVLQRELDQARSGNDTRVTELEAANKRILDSTVTRNPLSHPDVQSIIAPYDAVLNPFLRTVSLDGHNPGEIRGIMQEKITELGRIQAGPDSAEYRASMQAFRQDMADKLPADSVRNIISLVDHGVEVANKVNGKIKEIADNSFAYELKEATKQYTEHSKNWQQIESGWLNPTEEQIANDPFNPTVFLHGLAEADPELREQFNKTKKQVRATFMALPPVDPANLSGKTPEQIAEFYEGRERQHAQRLRNFYAKAGDMMAWYQVGPSVLKARAEREETLKDVRLTTPAPGQSEPTGERGGGDKVTKLSEFKPPAIPKF